jgi:hypothetical protein
VLSIIAEEKDGNMMQPGDRTTRNFSSKRSKRKSSIKSKDLHNNEVQNDEEEEEKSLTVEDLKVMGDWDDPTTITEP